MKTPFISTTLFISMMLIVMFTGCVVTRETFGHIYNLRSGKIIQAKLYNISYGYGRIAAQLPDGELLEGDYMFGSPRENLMPIRPRLHAEGYNKDSVTSTVPPGTWQEDYGFAPNSNINPVGTATLAGSQGTVLEIVFFTVNIPYANGDGVARDNKGNRYRVYFGEQIQ